MNLLLFPNLPFSGRTSTGFGLLILGLLVPSPLPAQTPPADDFNPGVVGEVYAIACQPDGKILVGGTFIEMGGRLRNGIARLFPDGTADPAFDPGVDRPPAVFAVQSDGKILVGGGFTTLAGGARQGLGRLNPDGSLDESFAAVTDGQVSALLLQADGKIIVGGGFSHLAGVAHANLGRLNPDGTFDVTFTAETDGAVNALAVQPDGKLLVGGRFAHLGGQPRTRLGRLLPDGSVDPGFHPQPGPAEMAYVSAIVAQPDGRIVVGGEFLEIDEEPRENLARLNADGSLDPGVHVLVDGFVSVLLPQADGGILVGGNFLTFGMGASVALGRLKPDGSVDTDFSVWAEFTVDELVEQPDGKILVGGILTSLNGRGRSGIGRLETTGPVSERLTYANGALTWRREGPGPEVWRATFEYSVDGENWTVMGDGGRIDGGWELAGVTLPEGALARVRGETPGARCFVTAWLGPPLFLIGPKDRTAAFGDDVRFEIRAGGSEPLAYQWQRDGEPLVDGDAIQGATSPMLTLRGVKGAQAGEYRVTVSNALGVATSSPAMLVVTDPLITREPADQMVKPGETATFSVEAAGSEPLTYQWRRNGEPLADGGHVSGAAGPVLTINDAADGNAGNYSVLVGNVYGSLISREILLRVAAVTVDPDFNVAVAQSQVDALAIQPDGKIVVAGLYRYLAGTERNGIGRLLPNGTADPAFGATAGLGTWITALGIQADGKILVGGKFSSLAGNGWNNLARLKSDGSADLDFAGSANDWVYCLAVQPDGKVLIGGDFTEVGVHPGWKVARLNPDGTTDLSFASAPGSLGWWKASVHTLAVQADGRILLGGWSRGAPFDARYHLERLLSDGTLDPSFTPTVDNWVQTLLVQPDGKILAGGQFTTVNGQDRDRIVRLNADGSLDPEFHATANGEVLSLALQADGKILLGGNFTELNGESHPYLGRLNADGSADRSFGLGADGSVLAVALDNEGFILAGGGFGQFGGERRTLLARLLNTEPAVRTLTPDGTAITWLRGGSTPEVAWTRFDVSTGGGNWTLLGEGVRIPGGWQLAGVTLPAEPSIRARGRVNYSRFNGASSWVEDYYGPLSILYPPLSRTNASGTTATFVVRAGGSQPLGYLWLKDGTPLTDGETIQGAHTPMLTLSNVWGPAGADYSVVISNSFGVVTSPVASLTVVGDPKITGQPVGLKVDVGEEAHFSVQAVGTAPLGYQWRKDGVDLPPATGSSLTLTNVQVADAGAYSLVVSNAYGVVTSDPALLEVNAVMLSPDFSEGVSGSVSALAVQPDGKILLGGNFGKLGGESRLRLARANPDGTPDPDFNPGADGQVQALTLQPDGRILVGGSFSVLAGQPRANIGRLNPDGSLDTGFNPGADATVFVLAQQADGKIVVAGAFGELGGRPRERVGRLNTDGTPDPAFDPGAAGWAFAPGASVYSLALRADGRILLGGNFQTAGDDARHTVLRLNPDGSLDGSFTCELDGQASTLVVQPDGRVLVGGAFGVIGGPGPAGVARLNADGSLDAAFVPQANGPVYSLALQSDGGILMGGDYTYLNGSEARRVARLRPDGTRDVHFRPMVGGPWQQSVYALALEPDGDLLVGGNFDQVADEARQGVARLTGLGTVSQGLERSGAQLVWRRSGPCPEVWRTIFEHSPDGVNWVALGEGLRLAGGWEWSGGTIPPGGSVRVRGSVSSGVSNGSGWFVEDYAGAPVLLAPPLAQGVKAGEVVRLSVKAAGSQPLAYQWLHDNVPLMDDQSIFGATTAVLTLANVTGVHAGGYSVQVANADGQVVSLEAVVSVTDPWVTGQPVSQEASVGGVATLRVGVAGSEPMSFQWLKDGVALPFGDGATLTLTDLELADAGEYRARITGPFGEAMSEGALLTVNGAVADPGFQAGTSAVVEALAVQTDGKVLLGGYFGLVNGVPRTGLARLNPSGRVDEGFAPEARGAVHALSQEANGAIWVAGIFSTLSGAPRTNLGRLRPDGSVAPDFAPDVNGTVRVLVPEPDGAMLVGGRFSLVQGQPHAGIARFLPDGTLDSSFAVQVSDVYSVVRQTDGKILIGGNFSVVNGERRRHLARLNPDGTLDAGFAAEADRPVQVVAVQPDGGILVGGFFTRLGGEPRQNLAKLNADGTVDTKFAAEPDGNIDTIVLQANGKILVGGGFARLGGSPRAFLGRLNPDGTPDLQFNPGANARVAGLALQPDGYLLVGGQFTSLAGRTAEKIGRLLNPDPADQRLLYDGSTLIWERTGATPEVSFVRFEYSTDRVSWSRLPPPARVTDGWELLDVSLPTNAVIRAGGYAPGGLGNGSGSWVATQLGAPVLLSEPVSLTKDVGAAASFAVGAAGSGPMTYQWLKDGTPLTDDERIHGAQTAELMVEPLTIEDAGQYSVVVSNAYGTVTSEPFMLAVNGKPILTAAPEDALGHVGGTAQFSVEATGTPPLAYQWQKDGQPLPDDDHVTGATNATLTLSNLSPDAAGEYSVVVSNAFGSVTTEPAGLTVNTALLDPGFVADAFPGVVCSVVQPDGKIVVGGTFTTLNEVSRKYLGRLNPDGTLDADFNPAPNYTVRAMESQPDGKLLIGGEFNQVGGEARSQIARINPDGSLDPAFKSDALHGAVYALAVQEGGKMLVGGGHLVNTQYVRGNLVRLNPDGSLDTSFRAELFGDVHVLVQQPDGMILVGGEFDSVGSRVQALLARLSPDGERDAGFVPNMEDYFSVHALAIEPDGQILVGGRFPSLAGQPRKNLGRLNPDGSLDADFTAEANDEVYTLALQADGSIVVGGRFSEVNGQPRVGIARLNAAGELDPHFSPGASGSVWSLTVQPDGGILAGGDFHNLGGGNTHFFGRLLPVGPVTDELTLTDTTLTWRRGGAGPEVWRVWFEQTLDGVTWSPLGVGTRIAAGWELAGVASPAGSTVRARGRVSAGQYNASSWVTEAYAGAPFLLTQPAGSTNDFGGLVTFRVEARGSAPLSYQWQKGGTPLADGGHITGAQTSELRLEGVSGGDAGDYTVVVSNADGSVTSRDATLAVVDPLITQQPASRTRGFGQDVSFEVAAAGTEPLAYQWGKDGAALPGATAATLDFTNLQAGDAGDYHVVVSNAHGEAVSETASLTLVSAPVILEEPRAQVVDVGGTAVLQVAAVGIEPLSYQWWKDGAVLPDANGPALEFATAQPADAGRYHVVVRNGAGETTSDEVALLVNLVEFDPDFQPGIGNRRFADADALAIQPDGLLVGGEFNTLGGEPRESLGWLNPDGTVADRFTVGVDISINCLAVQPDGRVLLGGRFMHLAGEARQSLGRLMPDGTLDQGFDPRIGDRLTVVNSLMVQPDGRILVGGKFSRVAGREWFNFVRLNSDGTPDATFPSKVSGEVACLAWQPDGKVVIGGSFVRLGDVEQAFLGRWNPDGTVDRDFAPQLDAYVAAIALEPDGDILLTGGFTTVNGRPRQRIARLKPDGSLDESFHAELDGHGASSLLLQADGGIIVGGDFTTVNGLSRPYVAKLTPDGRLDLHFAPAVASAVESLALQTNGDVLLGTRCLVPLPKPCTVLRRVFNPTPATRELRYEGSTITWLRGGSSPEAWRVTFDHSIDGVTWVSLGTPVRIAGGWELTDVNPPDEGTLQARAYVVGGRYSASGGFVETRLSLGAAPPVRILAATARFEPDGFTFEINGPAGATVRVEGGGNLVDWAELGTVNLDGGSGIFTDAEATASGPWFYRVRLVQ